MIEKSSLDSLLIGMQKITPPSVDAPSCMMLSKEWLIRGIGEGYYDAAEREVAEDKID